MSSFGDDLYAKTVHTTDVHSTGKIYWHDFSPPLTGSGISTLAAVLEAGNDANDQDIIGAGKIVMHDGDDPSTFVASSISGVTTLNCNLIVTGDGRAIEFGVLDDLSVGVDGASGGKILFNGTQGTNAITGASVANRVIVTNADLTDASNILPAATAVSPFLGTKIQETYLLKYVFTTYSEYSTNFRTSFVAQSANVMVEFRAVMRCDNRVMYGGLYDYNAGSFWTTPQTQNRFNYNDETDQDYSVFSWWIGGLTAGTTYYISPYFRTSSNTSYIYAGNSGTADGFAPAIFRVIDGGSNVSVY